MDQILESQQTPHISPSRASYGVSIVRIVDKIDRVITAPHCTWNPHTWTDSWNRAQIMHCSLSSDQAPHWDASVLTTQRSIMVSLNGILCRVTRHLCGEFTGHRWIPLSKASDAELWSFLWSAPEYTVGLTMVRLVIWATSRPLWRHCNDFCWHSRHTR